MPRVDPYKTHYDHYDYDYEPSTSGAVLLVGIIATIIVGSVMWADYISQPTGTSAPSAMSSPAKPSTPNAPSTVR